MNQAELWQMISEAQSKKSRKITTQDIEINIEANGWYEGYY